MQANKRGKQPKERKFRRNVVSYASALSGKGMIVNQKGAFGKPKYMRNK